MESTSDKPYAYDGLDGEGAIRVLILQPAASSTEELQATLAHRRLEDLPSYKAISYTWGEAEFTGRLYLDGRLLRIAANLAAALRRFRRSNAEEILWADAVCINQADDVEKGKQVALMSKIYGQASCVLIWLGEVVDVDTKTNEMIACLEELAATCERFGIKHNALDSVFYPDPDPIINVPSQDMLFKVLELAKEKHIDAVYKRPWFTRLWIVQEVTLASSAVLFLGPCTLDWITFAMATEVLAGVLLKLHASLVDISPLLDGFNAAAVDNAWRIVESRRKFRIMQNKSFVVLSQYQQYGLFTQSLQEQDCKDDRDRVYALLGLRNDDVQVHIVPDYQKSLFQVYAEFARAHLSLNDVELLYEAGIGRRRQSVDDVGVILPSWAIDLRKSNIYRSSNWVPWLMEGQKFSAGSNFLPKVLVTGDLRKVKVFTVLVDRVADHGIIRDTTKFAPASGGLSFEYMRDVTEITRAIIRGVKKPRDAYPTGEDLETARCRALLADGSEFNTYMSEAKAPPLTDFMQLWELYARFCLAEDGEVCQKDQERQEGGQKRDAKLFESLTQHARTAMKFHAYIEKTLINRCCFITKKGFMGLGLPEVQKGDLVAIIDGARTPFIVRQKENTSDFILIGTAFVHGIMYGEIVCMESLARRRGLMTLV